MSYRTERLAIKNSPKPDAHCLQHVKTKLPVILGDFDHSPTKMSEKVVSFVIKHRTMKVQNGGMAPHFNFGIRTQ